MLEKIYYGNTMEDWGISILIIIAAILLNRLIVRINRKVLKKVTAKSNIHYDAILLNALEKPVLMGILLLAIWIAASRLQLSKETKDMILKSYNLLIVLNITWFF